VLDGSFVHVTGDDWDQVGMGVDPRGAGAATCKIAGIAFTGSNPVPATWPVTSDNAVLGSPVRASLGLCFPPLSLEPTLSGHSLPHLPLSGHRGRHLREWLYKAQAGEPQTCQAA
jgi:hypothetical protein